MHWKTLAPALAAVALAIVMAQTPASAQETIDPADFSNSVTNPYFPLSTLKTLEYEGTEEGEDGETIETRGVITVLPDAKVIAGVSVLVARDEALADGELVESTLDYFAQHVDGTVYYFGEDVDNYEDGVLVDHDGSWLAGEGENLPGIFMPAEPKVGDTFDQERAPGIAEDHSEVLETGIAMTVSAGSFTGCIETEDVDPLGGAGAVENKFYCPGVGLVREEAEDEELELVSYTAAPAATPTDVPPTVAPAIAPAPTATAPSGIVAPATGGGSAGGDTLPALALALAGALLMIGVAMVTHARRGAP